MTLEQNRGCVRRSVPGCLLVFPGFFGGGMVAAGLAQIVDRFTGCRAPSSLPACHTWEFVLVGGVIGMFVLPGVVLWRLRRQRTAPTPRHSERS